jgi:hypothetical protein
MRNLKIHFCFHLAIRRQKFVAENVFFSLVKLSDTKVSQQHNRWDQACVVIVGWLRGLKPQRLISDTTTISALNNYQ